MGPSAPQAVAQLIADPSGSHRTVKFNTTAGSFGTPAKKSAFLLRGWGGRAMLPLGAPPGRGEDLFPGVQFQRSGLEDLALGTSAVRRMFHPRGVEV